MADICARWTECRATWNKGADGVMTQIKAIQKALPFPVKGSDRDNGPEFLNRHLPRYFRNRKQPIKFTRSRPYHSNDNAHAGRKNRSCARQLSGYGRLSDPETVKSMNDLYANEFSLFTNFFCPAPKLAPKAREGSKRVRKHSKPIAPAQRVPDHPGTPQGTEDKLSVPMKTLDPFTIQNQIQRKLKTVFKFLR